MLWIISFTVLIVLYYIIKKKHNYWKEKQVQHEKPWFFVGHLGGLLFRVRSMQDIFCDLYGKCNGRYFGMYQFLTPTLVVKDPDLIKQITVKDFDSFVDHRNAISGDNDPLFGNNLFSLNGQKWKDMRSTLSPAFTGSKMRSMFNLMSDCSVQFVNFFTKTLEPSETKVIEMKDTFTRYTNDVIATCAFGTKVDSLQDRNNEFYLMGKKTTNFSGIKGLKMIGFMFFPKLMNFFSVKLIDMATSNFFRNLVKDTMKVREEQNIIRHDMINLLMEARKGRLKHDEEKNEDAGFATVQESHIGTKHTKTEWTDDDLAAQAVLFFLAGFDTISTLLSFASHELAVHEHIQRTLQEEIDETLENYSGKVTYEGLLKMKYMDMVICETLRKWSPAPVTDRLCIKPYTIEPVLKGEVPIHIKPGDLVLVPIQAIHTDPNYYPEPDRFEPERFSDDNKSNINIFNYIPFGVGPRNCIASRFALLEAKVILFHLLSKFDLTVVDKTPIPLKLSTKNINPTVDEGFWLGIKHRSQLVFWILFFAVLIVLYFFIKKKHDYWKERQVPHEKPLFFLGHMGGLVFRVKSIQDIFSDLYEKCNGRYFGMYQFLYPALVLKDPDLIKQITVKDFDSFVDHKSPITEEIDPLFGNNLLALRGQKWKDMRSTLSPAFTGSKMRSMFNLMSDCSEQFANYFTKTVEPSETKVIEMKDTFTRYTNDVIATCAFGTKVDSLEDRNNEFYLTGKDITRTSGFRNFKFIGFLFFPKVMTFFSLKLFSDATSNFFRNLVLDTMKVREEQNIIRYDMINLLMETRKGSLKHEESTNEDAGFAADQESHIGTKQTKREWTDNELSAQALLFFFAGFDTVATLLTFASHELAVHEDIQRKLQQEIDETLEKCSGKITYEVLQKMKYMDMVICESLRKWTPLAITDRLCLKPYTIEPELKGENPVHLNPGDLIVIPIHAIHRDPNNHLDPERFDPERFSDENKSKMNMFNYMPFGVGPRNCLASRFALMEAKVIFFHLLSKFDLTVVEKTPIPLKLSTKSVNPTVDGGFWLGIKHRSLVK